MFGKVQLEVSSGMAEPKDNDLEQAKRIMAALVRQPPKTHDEMTGGKGKAKASEKKPLR
jgi:hypothetical protein